jgi:hypothetical protein
MHVPLPFQMMLDVFNLAFREISVIPNDF